MRELERTVMAYVLFMDLVRFSEQSMPDQRRLLAKLNDTVKSTDQFRKSHEDDELLCLPTGDGMALAFFDDPMAAVECAVQISRALRFQPDLRMRMGIHHGLVYRVEDINKARNVAGGGINRAQRVMDCGQAGHVLVSNTVAEALTDYGQLPGTLKDLGEREVKHRKRIHLHNFFGEDFGFEAEPFGLTKSSPKQQQAEAKERSNEALPTALPTGREIRKKGPVARKWAIPIVGGTLLVAAVMITWLLNPFPPMNNGSSPGGGPTSDQSWIQVKAGPGGGPTSDQSWIQVKAGPPGVTLHWNGLNSVRWDLLDASQEQLDFWRCEPGKACTQDVAPGEYFIRVRAIGYQPVPITVSAGKVSHLTKP